MNVNVSYNRKNDTLFTVIFESPNTVVPKKTPEEQINTRGVSGICLTLTVHTLGHEE